MIRASRRRFAVAAIGVALGCGSGESEPLFGGGGGGGGDDGAAASGDEGSAGQGSGGGSAPAVCDPSSAMNECEGCVLSTCCEEKVACDPGTKCAAFEDCARAAMCFAPEVSDFYACAVAACPDESTNIAVETFKLLAACARGNCARSCSP